MNSDYLDRTNNGTVFVGSDVNIFMLAALASGLRLYAQHKIRPNRNWTPTNMLKAASSYTNKKYKRGQYEEAATDLNALMNMLKSLPRNSQN